MFQIPAPLQLQGAAFSSRQLPGNMEALCDTHTHTRLPAQAQSLPGAHSIPSQMQGVGGNLTLTQATGSGIRLVRMLRTG